MACYMLLVEWWSGYHEEWSLCSPHLLTWLPALLARQWVSPGCSSDLGGLYWLSPSHIDFHPPQPLCNHLDFHPHSIDFHAHVKRRKRQIPRIRESIRKRHNIWRGNHTPLSLKNFGFGGSQIMNDRNQPIPACTQYLIEYSICTSVVLDIFINRSTDQMNSDFGGSSLQFLDLSTAKVYRCSTYVYHF